MAGLFTFTAKPLGSLQKIWDPTPKPLGSNSKTFKIPLKPSDLTGAKQENDFVPKFPTYLFNKCYKCYFCLYGFIF